MRRPVIGVTGLPCSGKSYAARLLASGEATGERGELVQADDLGHRVLTRPEVVEQLRDRFGGALLRNADAAEIRRRIAARVFQDSAELAWLESVVHPLVDLEARSIVAAIGGGMPVVVEAALLFAAGMDKSCDVVLVIEAGFRTRLDRAAARRWNREELERRDRRLLPLFEPERLREVGDKLVVVRNDEDDNLLGRRLAAALDLINK